MNSRLGPAHRFYKTRSVTHTSPSKSVEHVVSPNPLIGRPPQYTNNPIFFQKPVPWSELPHITADRLPEQATDIRGIDNSGFKLVDRRSIYKPLPVVSTNAFFTLKFFPQSHYLSVLRKSNIAYTFTNYGSPFMNSRRLEEQFKSYKGPMRNLSFFRTVPSPMGTAAARIRNRKLVKRSLHEALLAIVPNNKTCVSRVSGIFHFKLHCVAITTEEVNSLKSNMMKAVGKIYSDSRFQASLASVVSMQNSTKSRISFEDVSFENTVGESEVPGYYPKLPYFTASKPRSRKN